MGAFKTVTEAIEQWFKGNDGINEVTDGDIFEVDLTGHTTFPLAHIIYTGVTYNEGVSVFTYQILLLDTFTENEDNKITVLDTMNEVCTQFTDSLYDGSLFNSQIRMNVSPSSQIMYDQLQNRLYGVSLTVSMKVPNGIKICT